jgi:hypothetical protein
MILTKAHKSPKRQQPDKRLHDAHISDKGTAVKGTKEASCKNALTHPENQRDTSKQLHIVKHGCKFQFQETRS